MMPRILTRRIILYIGVGFFLFVLLRQLFQWQSTAVIEFALPSPLLREFCENINDRTLPMTDYQTHNPEETDLFFANIDAASHRNCQRFRLAFLPQESPVAAQEAAYPLAFTIVAHKNIRQLARLLRMIHRPANFYCIHLDRRSSPEFTQAVAGVAACFGPNVYLVPPESRVEVYWGNASVLKPQLVCAEAALRRPGWQYLLNVAAEEVPLRTNLELIAAVQALNGSNLLEAVRIGGYGKRTKGVTLPNETEWFKGSIYGAYRRDFLDFALHSPATQPLLKILFSDKDIKNPDELFFQTVAFNAQFRAPGGCLYTPLISEVAEGYPARYVIWEQERSFCPTKYVRSVCILGSPHVRELRRTFHLFANKMHADYYPEAYDCMEQWYFMRLRREWMLGHVDWEAFEPWHYRHMTCSRYHMP